MVFAIQVCGWLIGLPLQLLVIAVLLRGGYRRFPLIFAYMLGSFLTTVMEIPSAVSYWLHHVAGSLPEVYWYIEIVMQLLIYAVVMSLIYQATARLRIRRTLRASLIAGAILFAAASFLIHHSPMLNKGTWMTLWTRDLNFCSAILDLALWFMLIASREKDRLLLLLSGGLGIQFTGDAIAESIRAMSVRHRSHPLAAFGGVLNMLAYLVFLYIWWQAFRTEQSGGPRAVKVDAGTGGAQRRTPPG